MSPKNRSIESMTVAARKDAKCAAQSNASSAIAVRGLPGGAANQLIAITCRQRRSLRDLSIHDSPVASDEVLCALESHLSVADLVMQIVLDSILLARTRFWQVGLRPEILRI